MKEELKKRLRLAVNATLTQHVRMKKRELEKRLKELGWNFLKHGGKHDIWTNGKQQTQVPRHAEVKENLARSILKMAQGR